jgi:hypothetical protein
MGSQRRSPSFPLNPSKEWQPTSSTPSMTLTTVASLTSSSWIGTSPPPRRDQQGRHTRSFDRLP